MLAGEQIGKRQIPYERIVALFRLFKKFDYAFIIPHELTI